VSPERRSGNGAACEGRAGEAGAGEAGAGGTGAPEVAVRTEIMISVPAPAVSVTIGLEGAPLAAGRRNMS